MITTPAQHYVYEWVRPDYNEAYYVGKGSGKRAYNMVRDNDYTNRTTANLIQNGMQPEVRIIAWFVNEKAAYAFEKERIAFLKPLGFLTNDHPGGDAPPSWKGRKRSEKTKKLQGIAKLGDLNPMKNPETVAKVMASKKEFYASDDGRAWATTHSGKLIQLYETPQGKKILERMGQKNSQIQAAKGEDHHSKRPEVREKIRVSKIGGKNPQSKPVVELTTGREFLSGADAASYFGVKVQSVWMSCRKARTTKGGFKFRWKEPI